MLFYTGDAFPGWKGSVRVGSLQPGGLVRLELRDGRVVREERDRDDGLASRIRDLLAPIDSPLAGRPHRR